MKAETSALLDGELEDHATGPVLKALKNDPALQQTWEIYHLLGDVLRNAPALSPNFSRRIEERLKAEPTLLAPRQTQLWHRPLRLVLPLAASVMGIGAVAWVALSLQQPDRAQLATAQSAATPQTVAQNAAPQNIRSVSLPQPTATVREYLVAHQGVSPSSNIHGVAHYVRSVSDSRPSETQ